MSVIFKRGPQMDETSRFIAKKENTKHDFEQSFMRVSTFYKDGKTNKY